MLSLATLALYLGVLLYARRVITRPRTRKPKDP